MSPAPVIIAIDGRSGAGKTTLAIELAARLREHHKVSLFHLEDIYPGWNGLAAGIERYASTVLAPLHRGEPAEWVSWDWNAHYDGDTRTTQPAEIVLVEGVGAAAEAARPFLAAVDLGRFTRTGPAQQGPRPGRRKLRTLLGRVGRPGAGVAGQGRRSGSCRRPGAQSCRRRRPGGSAAGPPVPAGAFPGAAPGARRPPRPRAPRRTDRRRPGPCPAVRVALRPLGQCRLARLLPGTGRQRRGGTEPLQHPGGRRRPVRPVGPAQFGQHPGEHRQRQCPDGGALLPLARRRLGPPRPPRPRGLPLRVHPGLARLPRLRTQTRDRRQ